MSRESLGRHVLVEFFECSSEKLNDVQFIERTMIDAAREAGATIINSTFHHFSPFGVSGVVVVQESHLAIHTWPEFGYAAVDIFTCGDTVDPWRAYHLLMKALEAEHGAALEMHRGQMDILRKRAGWDISEDQYEPPPLNPQISRNIWFTERHEHIAQSFRHRGDVLFRKKSPYQRVEVYDTYAYGKMLVLDSLVQLSEADEFIYHEMIVHPAMFTHLPASARVLIVGGGDGATAREVLRHSHVEHVDLVEIDQVVMEAARKYFPSASRSLDHPNLQVHLKNGLDFVFASDSESYDFVFCDVSDPVGPSQGAFSPEFHRNIYRILRSRGIMVIQCESPFFRKEVLYDVVDMLQEIYGEEHVHPYYAGIPTYPTGTWYFVMACKGDDLHPLRSFHEQEAYRFSRKHRLRYYDPVIHRAAFSLPPFVREFLEMDEEEYYSAHGFQGPCHSGQTDSEWTRTAQV